MNIFMGYFFALGFLYGLRHALDADHLAAVASLATRTNSARETLRMGLAWGLGHGVTLLIVCGIVLAVGAGFSGRIASGLEFLVGLMLILLGGDVIRRAIRDRIHAHAHRHHGETTHLHIHSHAAEPQHAASEHAHGHRNGLTGRALAIGLMHGLAGSAALLLLSMGAMENAMIGLGYVMLFGLGSMIGMGALSLTIALPLKRCANMVTWGYNGIHMVIGAGTIALGGFIVAETADPAISLLTGA
jgi:ABC-type nickel/cobalt efflux system permease component RcnA